MLISTKGRYALRAVVDLAEHMPEGYIPLKDIASRQDISSKYLEAIIKTLVKEKIVVGVRGKGGGYKLNVPPADITVARILRLAEGSLSPVEGLDGDHSSLTRMSQYRMLDMWRELDELITDIATAYRQVISDLYAAGCLAPSLAVPRVKRRRGPANTPQEKRDDERDRTCPEHGKPAHVVRPGQRREHGGERRDHVVEEVRER